VSLKKRGSLDEARGGRGNPGLVKNQTKSRRRETFWMIRESL